MEITENTPRTAITIQGETFEIGQPFGEGHICNANQAAALNQLLAENIRNNFGAQMKKAEKDGKDIPDQADLDTYVEKYEFGIRTGGFASADPVEREARKMAADHVKAAWRDEGYPMKDLTAEDLNNYINDIMAENGDALREVARENIDRRKSVVSGLKIKK